MRRFFPALLLLFYLPVHAQILSFGVKGGVPLTSAYSTVTSVDSVSSVYDRLYVIGPTAEIHLPFRISIEADALYRRNGFKVVSSHTARSAAINDWQVPVLAKYDLISGPVRPFVNGGLVYRHVSASDFTAANTNTAGVALGGGLTLKLLSIRLSPEIRYAYWPTKSITSSTISSITSSNNQADFLLGISF